MIDFLLAVLQAFWTIMKEASVYLLVGFFLAGVLAVLVPRRLLTRFVGTGKFKSVLWGSVLGAPLPLCSCGVLPTAVGLRKEGATPGATVAFLVATPETGVRQHQLDLRAYRSADDGVSSHCRRINSDCRRRPDQPVRSDGASRRRRHWKRPCR